MRPWIRRSLLGAAFASIALGGIAACGHRQDHQAWSQMNMEERAKARDKLVERIASRMELNAQQKQKLGVLVTM